VKKRNPEEQYGFFYDEDGTNLVSQQIMDSYNSGIIGEQNQVHEETHSHQQEEM
jgi:hypothetical protein